MPAVEDTVDSESRPPFGVRSFGLSDRGQKRESNEDCVAIAELARTLRVHHTNLPQSKSNVSSHRAHVYLIADGVGGALSRNERRRLAACLRLLPSPYRRKIEGWKLIPTHFDDGGLSGASLDRVWLDLSPAGLSDRRNAGCTRSSGPGFRMTNVATRETMLKFVSCL